MPMVEGLGDEVTIILGLLTIIIVLLIAWLSTHTRDIPFFSVIVVELSQRASRNQQNRRSQTPNLQQETNQENNEATPSVESIVQSETSLANTVKQTVSETLRAENIQNVDSSITDVTSGVQQCDSQNITNENIERTEAAASNEFPTDENLEVIASGDSSKNEDSPKNSEESEYKDSNVVTDLSETNVNRDLVVGSVSADVTEILSQTEEVRLRSVPSRDSASHSETSNVRDSSTSEHHETSSDGQIRIRLKYLNDTQRLVYSSPTDTIGQFRRAHFSSELAANKLVRLIFNGQDMRNDTSTLQGYNITDNSVIHCLITQNLQSAAQLHVDHGDTDLQLGTFMMPLFGFVLAAIWYLRITQRQYFNAVSTLSLAGISFLYLLGCVSIWRSGQRREHEHVD